MGGPKLDMMPLAEALRCAVPGYIAEAEGWSAQRRVATAVRCAGADALPGDALIFGASRWQTTARAFNSLAQGLAMAAYQPGGATYLDTHWCVDRHDRCPHPPARPRLTEAEGIAMWRDFHAILDEYEALVGPSVAVRRDARPPLPRSAVEPVSTKTPRARRPVETLELPPGGA